MSGTEKCVERVAVVTNQVNEFGKSVGELEDTVAYLRIRLVPVTRPIDAKPVEPEKDMVKPADCTMSSDIGGYVGRLKLQIASLQEAVNHLEI